MLIEKTTGMLYSRKLPLFASIGLIAVFSFIVGVRVGVGLHASDSNITVGHSSKTPGAGTP